MTGIAAADGLEVRLSFNQITADPYGMRDVVDACVQHGVKTISVWRHKVDELGLEATAGLIRDAGLGVSSLCRGGFFPAATEAEVASRHEDNVRALEEAATLGSPLLVLVCGPAPDKDLDRARQQVVDGIAALLPVAERLKVKIGIEPLHPVFAGDRSVIVTLAQANEIAECFPASLVGVVVDVYHVWWDPCVYDGIRRAADRILGFHVSDWLVPSPDPLMGRGLMGDGVIELRRLRKAVEAAGYFGPIEVEIFNRDVWAMPLDDLMTKVKERFVAHV